MHDGALSLCLMFVMVNPSAWVFQFCLVHIPWNHVVVTKVVFEIIDYLQQVVAVCVTRLLMTFFRLDARNPLLSGLKRVWQVLHRSRCLNRLVLDKVGHVSVTFGCDVLMTEFDLLLHVVHDFFFESFWIRPSKDRSTWDHCSSQLGVHRSHFVKVGWPLFRKVLQLVLSKKCDLK